MKLNQAANIGSGYFEHKVWGGNVAVSVCMISLGDYSDSYGCAPGRHEDQRHDPGHGNCQILFTALITSRTAARA